MEVRFTTTTSELLDTIPVVDGQVIAIADEPGYYYDMLHQRKRVSNPLYIDDVTPTHESLYSSYKVQEMINSINSFEIVMVDELPNVGRDHVIYFVKKEDTSGDDYCDEYMYISDKWELVGHTKVTYNRVTYTEDGLMSYQDKIKLDGIAEGAQVGTITGVKVNGSVVASEGEADLGYLFDTLTTSGEGNCVTNVSAENNTLSVELGKMISGVKVNGSVVEPSSGIVDLGSIQSSENTVTHNPNQGCGSSEKGVYVDEFGHVQPTDHSIQSDVPENAVFTDTVTSVTTTGEGNAVVNISSENGQITATLGEIKASSTVVPLTLEEYEALPESEKMNGDLYYVEYDDSSILPELEAKADKVANTPGTAGSESDTSGNIITVPYVTVNSQGVISGYGQTKHTIVASEAPQDPQIGDMWIELEE